MCVTEEDNVLFLNHSLLDINTCLYLGGYLSKYRADKRR